MDSLWAWRVSSGVVVLKDFFAWMNYDYAVYVLNKDSVVLCWTFLWTTELVFSLTSMDLQQTLTSLKKSMSPSQADSVLVLFSDSRQPQDSPHRSCVAYLHVKTSKGQLPVAHGSQRCSGVKSSNARNHATVQCGVCKLQRELRCPRSCFLNNCTRR